MNINGQTISMKNLFTILGFVVTLILATGGIVGAYYKSQVNIQTKFEQLEKKRGDERLEAQKQYLLLINRIDLLEKNLENQLSWQDNAIEQLADDLPDVIREHEYRFHPTKGREVGSTKFEVKLPKKPDKVEAMPLRDPAELFLEQRIIPPVAAD